MKYDKKKITKSYYTKSSVEKKFSGNVESRSRLLTLQFRVFTVSAISVLEKLRETKCRFINTDEHICLLKCLDGFPRATLTKTISLSPLRAILAGIVILY